MYTNGSAQQQQQQAGGSVAQWLTSSMAAVAQEPPTLGPSAPGSQWLPSAQRPPKDPHWLTLEVCREYARGKCNRRDEDCKFAHPPPQMEVQSGRVTCCFDSLHQRCHRVDPPCKYFHPPDHLKEQLISSPGGAGGGGGRMLKGARNIVHPVMGYTTTPAAAGLGGLNLGSPPGAGGNSVGATAGSLQTGLMPAAVLPFLNPYAAATVAQNANSLAFNTYLNLMAATGGVGLPSVFGGTAAAGDGILTGTGIGTTQSAGTLGWMVPQMTSSYPSTYVRPPRSDKIEICREYQRGMCSRGPNECRYAHPPDDMPTDSDNCVTVCMDYLKGRCTRDVCRYLHLPPHLQSQLKSSTSPHLAGSVGSLGGQQRSSPTQTANSLTSAMAALQLSPTGGSTALGAGGSYGSMPGGSPNYHQAAQVISSITASAAMQQQLAYAGNQSTSDSLAMTGHQFSADLTGQRF